MPSPGSNTLKYDMAISWQSLEKMGWRAQFQIGQSDRVKWSRKGSQWAIFLVRYFSLPPHLNTVHSFILIAEYGISFYGFNSTVVRSDIIQNSYETDEFDGWLTDWLTGMSFILTLNEMCYRLGEWPHHENMFTESNFVLTSHRIPITLWT